MSPEVPFFANRRKRAGLVRRIGNLANRLPGADPDLQAMHMIAIDQKTPHDEAAHLRQMIVSQLKFVSPAATTDAGERFLAERAGVLVEFANQTTYQENLSRAPETMRAAFSDVAAIAQRNLE